MARVLWSRIRLFGICAVVLATAIACGTKAGNIAAVLTDTSIDLSSNTAKAGDVTFDITNKSASLPHEFVVLQTDLPAGSLPIEADNRIAEDEYKDMGEQGDLPAGQTAVLKLNLPAGHYVVVCNIEGHYKAGMHADFTVTP